jgi:hypothetical protein
MASIASERRPSGRAKGSELLAGHRRRSLGAQGGCTYQIQDGSITMFTKSARTMVEAEGEAVVRSSSYYVRSGGRRGVDGKRLRSCLVMGTKF